MIITFIGHNSLPNCTDLYETIKRTIIENIKNSDQIFFYCGGYGDFDNICAKACRCIKNEHYNCEVLFITPYITESQQKKIKYLINAHLYDSTIYPPLENVPLKFAISKRNEWMVENADIIIAYVNRTFGGAYKTLQYARKKKKHIINLAE